MLLSSIEQGLDSEVDSASRRVTEDSKAFSKALLALATLMLKPSVSQAGQMFLGKSTACSVKLCNRPRGWDARMSPVSLLRSPCAYSANLCTVSSTELSSVEGSTWVGLVGGALW